MSEMMLGVGFWVRLLGEGTCSCLMLTESWALSASLRYPWGKALMPGTLDPEGWSPEVGSGRVWSARSHPHTYAKFPSSPRGCLSVTGLK